MKKTLLTLTLSCLFSIIGQAEIVSPVNVYFIDGHDQKGNEVIGLGSVIGVYSPSPEFDAYILNKDNKYIYAHGMFSGDTAYVRGDDKTYLLVLHPWMVSQEQVCSAFNIWVTNIGENSDSISELKLFYPDTLTAWVNIKKAQWYGFLNSWGLASSKQQDFYFQYQMYETFDIERKKDLFLYVAALKGMVNPKTTGPLVNSLYSDAISGQTDASYSTKNALLNYCK